MRLSSRPFSIGKHSARNLPIHCFVALFSVPLSAAMQVANINTSNMVPEILGHHSQNLVKLSKNAGRKNDSQRNKRSEA